MKVYLIYRDNGEQYENQVQLFEIHANLDNAKERVAKLNVKKPILTMQEFALLESSKGLNNEDFEDAYRMYGYSVEDNSSYFIGNVLGNEVIDAPTLYTDEEISGYYDYLDSWECGQGTLHKNDVDCDCENEDLKNETELNGFESTLGQAE